MFRRRELIYTARVETPSAHGSNAPLRRFVALALCAVLALFVISCGDDGSDTRDSSSGSASGGSGSGSGSGSGTGLSLEDSSGKTVDDPLIVEAVTQYTQYVQQQVDKIVVDTKEFTDAIRAGDLETAKAEFAPSRYAWESIEPIAGLIPDIDGAVDARVDDFESEEDPTWTGWHRLEYLLFEKGTLDGAVPFADQLDEDIATLKTEIADLVIPPDIVAVGAAELIEEVSGGKITGEEDRYSGTDLSDFAANLEGSQKAIEFLTPALEEKDPELLAEIQAGFTEVEDSLAPYKDGDGYKNYSELTPADQATMKTALAGLSESLSQVAGALGLS